jgi:hypothetical protein
VNRLGPHFLHVPLKDCAAYTLSIEAVEVDGEVMRLLHCVVRDWSATTARLVAADVSTLAALCQAPLYVMKSEVDEKFRAFVGLYGFAPCADVEIAGHRVEVFKRG